MSRILIDRQDRCCCSICVNHRERLVFDGKAPTYSRWLAVMTFCPITCESESFVLVDRNDSNAGVHFAQLAAMQFPTRIVYGTGITLAHANQLGLPK